jgi:TolA-binding protein
MRGISYALAEIAVFMIAATLIGYTIGRLAGPSRWARRQLRERDQMDARLGAAAAASSRLEHHAAALAAEVAASEERVLELELEVERLLAADAQTTIRREQEQEQERRAVHEPEVEELLSEIDKQRAMIEHLESVAADAGSLESTLKSRDGRIAMLEAALLTAEPADPHNLAVAFSASSDGSGRWADATIDFEILP